MSQTWKVPATVFDAMAAQAEKDYPEETCGLLFGPDGAIEIVPMENVQNALHERDPERYDRDATTAYQFDPLEFQRVQREKETEQGLPLRSIYHSHPDKDAYFSQKDRADAAPEGWGPLFPGAIYIVFSVRDGKSVDAKGYRWSDDHADFVDVTIERVG